jgi:hypothetical protein
MTSISSPAWQRQRNGTAAAGFGNKLGGNILGRVRQQIGRAFDKRAVRNPGGAALIMERLSGRALTVLNGVGCPERLDLADVCLFVPRFAGQYGLESFALAGFPALATKPLAKRCLIYKA